MDLRQLRTFQAVAELGSVSKAADHLHIAQAALSRQIKLLEHELRTPLFGRNGRGMVLTDAGLLLLQRIGGLVHQIEQVRDDIISLNSAPSGRVVLGLVPTVSCVLAGRVAQRVTTELPNVSLRLVESYGGHLVEWLHRGEIDLGIIYGQPGGMNLNVEPLASDNLVIIGSPRSGLSEQRDGALAWLAGQRLVLPSRSHGLRLLLERAATRKRVSLNIVAEADSFRALIDMVERGIGYSVLPPSAIVRERSMGTLEASPLTRPRVVRNLVIASPVSRQRSLAAQAVVALLRSEAAAVAKEGLWEMSDLEQRQF